LPPQGNVELLFKIAKIWSASTRSGATAVIAGLATLSAANGKFNPLSGAGSSAAGGERKRFQAFLHHPQGGVQSHHELTGGVRGSVFRGSFAILPKSR